jgi:hypothetical protein
MGTAGVCLKEADRAETQTSTAGPTAADVMLTGWPPVAVQHMILDMADALVHKQ